MSALLTSMLTTDNAAIAAVYVEQSRYLFF